MCSGSVGCARGGACRQRRWERERVTGRRRCARACALLVLRSALLFCAAWSSGLLVSGLVSDAAYSAYARPPVRCNPCASHLNWSSELTFAAAPVVPSEETRHLKSVLLNEPAIRFAAEQGITLENGDRYTGQLIDGIPQGDGQLIYKDGSVYTGQFENGKPNGSGFFASAIGDVLEGHFRDSSPDGEVSVKFANGSRYLGSMKGGRLEGDGDYSFADGTRYVGHWEDNFPDGPGALTYAVDSGRAVRRVSGIWKRGGLRLGGDVFAFKVKLASCKPEVP